MARIRSVDFLPEIFQTEANKEFLSATLDQIIQQPKLKRTQGYIGHKFGAGTDYSDIYLPEPTEDRANYQFEPSITFLNDDQEVIDAITYPEILDALHTKGAHTNKHDRLFESDIYSWDPLIDFDKLVNYGQYYWLPTGPDSVDVFSSEVTLEDSFDISTSNLGYYNFSGVGGENPTLVLARGGNYEFSVNQLGDGFWIQTEPGIDGKLNHSPNISSRDVLGVANNGDDVGTVTFNVPQANAQSQFQNLPIRSDIDFVTTARFDEINGKLVSEVANIDGVADMDNRTIIFTNNLIGDSNDMGWVDNAEFENGNYDVNVWAGATYYDTLDERTQLFRINVIGTGDTAYINLSPIDGIDIGERFTVNFGTEYANRSFYRNASGLFEELPLLTAANDILYYQDGTNPNKFGVIKLVDTASDGVLDVNDIIGKERYTAPNGVVFTNGLKVKFRGTIIPAEYEDEEYYVEGVGSAIRLVKVRDLITPEDYIEGVTEPWDVSPWDTIAFEESANAPLYPDYLTINRASRDLNAWSRSNRWFHIDVIKATAQYNESIVDLDNNFRAKRPIVEFLPDLKLFDYGTESATFIDVIDFRETDALSNVHGSGGYAVAGYSLFSGSRIVFANDADTEVRNKVYEVQIVDPDGADPEYSEIINLIDTGIEILPDMMVTCRVGLSDNQQQYVYDGVNWIACQVKNQINQPPLFDVFDTDTNSLGDNDVYRSTTFKGTKIFSYKQGTGVKDPILGFPLSYMNIDNLGDIVFENNIFTDKFIYVSGSSSVEEEINKGYIRKYNNRTDYSQKIGWVNSIHKNWPQQIFTFEYANEDLILDVKPKEDIIESAIKVYVNNSFVYPASYNVTVLDDKTVISLTDVNEGDIVRVKIASAEASDVAYYDVPNNLKSNVFNENINLLSLGTILNHFNHLVENVNGFDGNVNGANNLRDFGNVAAYGDVIIQHSAPFAPMATLLSDPNYDFFAAVDHNAKQYEKFKYQIIEYVANNELYDRPVSEVLDLALKYINEGKSTGDAYYWSDMLPFGGDYTETLYEISVISTDTFNTVNVYDFDTANSQGLLVYLNDNLLTRDVDYEVATDGPRIRLLTDVDYGDILKIHEFNTTYGNFVPSTPTKMGLYPQFLPRKFIDDTYQIDQIVIEGHDGSIMIGFGDLRDDVLLEFEKRIYNNLRSKEDSPIKLNDIIPGQFRTTDYTDQEITDLLSVEFLNWSGWHKLPYKRQDYERTNEWTWNYSTASNKLDDSILKGNWRGIYKHVYDTDRPHTHPWEMLGLSLKPSWWETRYGPAPYTSGNLVLWEDLEAGLIKEPLNERVDERYVRPGLTSIIPADSTGKLRTPFDVLVKNYIETDFRKQWNVGDIAPTENAWRRSSSWPFAVQKLFALTKPAKYFSFGIDRDRWQFSNINNQYLYDNRFRLDTRTVEVFGPSVPKHSYLNWIVEYNNNYGIPSTDRITNTFNNLDVRLTYRFAGFTDKNYLKIFTDKSSPNSSNTSLLIPDESFSLVVHKNQSYLDTQYSSVMIQKTTDGYAVYGNSQNQSYFNVMKSIPNGHYDSFYVGAPGGKTQTIRISKDHTDEVYRIPYGQTFTTENAVVDFLSSYGEYLERSGMKFKSVENAYEMNWRRMCEEFAYWANQGWTVGSIININPCSTTLEYEKENVVVDDIRSLALNEMPMDQNRQQMLSKDYCITRLENNFKFNSLTGNILSYLQIKTTSYEHLLVLDNVSIFSDLLYQPVTGLRQNRVKLDGFTTFEWNGQLDAQGFILNQDNVADWQQFKYYNKGDIVKYKNDYWAAATKIQPKDELDFDEWIKIDYDQISKGLLPNLSTKADAMTRYYNSSRVNLEQDADLLGLGITGFRPRSYMEALNIDDISQFNIYQDLVEDKGTTRSANLFRNIEIDGELSEYDIFENWAIKRAEFGAKDNKKYVELSLNEEQLQSNPGLVEIGLNGDETDADQFILVDDIYKQSIKHNNRDIFPLLKEDITDVSLPTAGYVNIDDVDFTVFDINDLSPINERLDDVVNNAIVWIAKINKYDWNVYQIKRRQNKLVQAIDNLDGTLSLVFEDHVKEIIGDMIVIKQFDPAINGAYRINRIEDLYTIIIPGSLAEGVSTITGEGVLFKLINARFEQPSDVVDSEYANNLVPGSKIWTDKNYDNKWRVFEKQDAFTSQTSLLSVEATSDTGFGTASDQGLDGAGLIVGGPGFGSTGALYCYNKSGFDYIYSATLSGGVNGLTEYGASVSFAKNWAIAGAPGTANNSGVAVVIKRDRTNNFFFEWQVLTIPESEMSYTTFDSESTTFDSSSTEFAIEAEDMFGYDVVLSEDEQWAYVSAPVGGKVYAYQFVKYQDQEVEYTGNGSTNTYPLAGSIVVDSNPTVGINQITVSVNGSALNTSQFEININGDVAIYSAPAAGDLIKIRRKDSLSPTGITGTTISVAELYTATSLDALRVYVDSVLLRPHYDYKLTGTDIVLTNALTGSETVIIKTSDHFAYNSTITGPANERFGEKITTTSDGQQLLVTAPLAGNWGPGTSPDWLEESGRVYVYERVVERKVVRDDNVHIYNVTSGYQPAATNNVHLNGRHLLNSVNNVNADYSINNNGVNWGVAIDSNIDLVIGDKIDIDINDYQLVQTLALGESTINEGGRFGEAISVCRTDCSLYVGAPRDSSILPEAGSVTRFLNKARVQGRLVGTVQNPTVTGGDSIRIDNVVIEFTNTTLDQVVADINNKNIPNIEAANENDYLVIRIINQNEAPIRSKMTIMPGQGTAFADLGLEVYEDVQTIVSPKPEAFGLFGSSVFVEYSSTNLVIGAKSSSAYIRTTFDKKVQQTIFDSGSGEFFDPIRKSGVVYTYNLLPSANFNTPGKFIFGQQLYDVAPDNNNIPTMKEGDDFGHSVNYVNGVLVITSPGYSTNVENVGRIVVFKNKELLPTWRNIQTQPETVDIRLINTAYLYNSGTNQIKTYLDCIDPKNNRLLGAVRENLDYIGAVNPANYNTDNSTGVVWESAHVGKYWWDTSNVRYLEYNQEDERYSARNWGQLYPGSSVDVYEWVESNSPPSTFNGEVYSEDYSAITRVDASRTITTKYYFWAKNTLGVNREIGKTLSTQTVADYIENPQTSGIPYISLIRKNMFAVYNVRDYLTSESNIIHIESNNTFSDNNVFVEYELVRENNTSDFIPTPLYQKLQDSFCGVNSLGSSVPDLALSETDRYGIQFRPRQSMFVDRMTALKNYLQTTNAIMAKYPLVESKTFNLLQTQEQEPHFSTGAWDYKVINLQELGYQNLEIVPTGYKYLVESDEINDGLWTIYQVDEYNELQLIRVQNFDTTRYWYYVDWYAEGYSSYDKPEKIVDTYSQLLSVFPEKGTIYKVKENSNGNWELYEHDGNTWNRIALENGTIQFSEVLWNYTAGRFGFDSEVFDAQFLDQEPVIELRQIIRAINEEILINEFALDRNKLTISLFNYILTEQGSVEWLYKTSLIDVSHKVRDLIQYPTYKKDNQDYVLDYIKESKPYHVKIREFLLRYEGLENYYGNITDFDIPSYWSAEYEKFISPVLDDGIALLDTDVSNTQPSADIWQALPWNDWFNNYKLSISAIVLTNPGSGYTEVPQVTVTGEADEPAILEAIITGDGQIREIIIVDSGSGYRTTPTVKITGGNGSGATAVLYTEHETARAITPTIRYDRVTYQSKVVLFEENDNSLSKNLFWFYDGELDNSVYPLIWNEFNVTIPDAPNKPVLYRVVELNTDDPADTPLVNPSKYEAVPYTVLQDGSYNYALDPVEKIYLREGLAKWYQLDGQWVNENNNNESRNYVRYGNKAYRVEVFNSLTSFEPTYYSKLTNFDDEIISGIDRTYGFYVADVNNPGLDIALLINGLDFPGIQLYGPDFAANTGFDVTGFDVYPWDNLEYDTLTGSITYNDNILDTSIFTTFLGDYQGVDMSGVIIEQAEATVNYANGEITGVTMTNPGLGYDVNVPPSVEFSDPYPNENAILSIATDGNAVIDIPVTNSGFGYIVTPDVTIIEANPTPGEQAYGNSTIDGMGYVIEADITVTGNGYEFIPQVVFDPPPSIADARATMVAGVDHSNAGSIDNIIIITNGGSDYLSAPQVTVTPPPGSVQAEASATIADHVVDSVSVTVAGNYYANPPTVQVGTPTETGVQATADASVTSGFVNAINVVNPGYLYETAPAVTIVPEPPTTGIQATAEAFLNPNTSGAWAQPFDSQPLDTEGTIGYVNPVNVGSGYTVAPTVTLVSNDFTPGIQAEATGTTTGNSVDTITVTVPGSGYTIPPTVIISAPDIPGTQATATASVSGDTVPLASGEGNVISITITNPGTGYTSDPTITISAPDTDITLGTGAIVTANISGESAPLYEGQGSVISFTVVDPGTGYVNPPTVVLSAPDTVINHGIGATAEAVIDATTGVTTINITNPGNYYDLPPNVQIGAPTTPRTATVDALVTDGQVSGFTITDGGWGYNNVPGVTLSAPDTIPVTAQVGALITGDAVTGYIIADAGAGYLTPPTLTVDVDPSIVDLIARGDAVVSNRKVIDIIMTHPGEGYVMAPGLTIDAPTGLAYHGSGATAEAVVVDNEVTSITITNPGTGYDLQPSVQIDAPTRYIATATGTAVIGGEYVTDIDITFPGSGYLVQPTVEIGRPSNIDPDVPIDGGAFIDIYHSHAPEELVPGSTFDTLDFKVYTRPGYDYTGNGHGFDVNSVIYEYNNTPISFKDVIDHEITIIVVNGTTGRTLYETENYTVDWYNKEVTILNNVNVGDAVKIFVYSVGGGNQIYRKTVTGDAVFNNQLEIPVNVNDIESIMIMRNGESSNAYSYEGDLPTTTIITFTDLLDPTDFVSITVFGEIPDIDEEEYPDTIIQTDLWDSEAWDSEIFAHEQSVNLYELQTSLNAYNRGASYPVTETFTTDGVIYEFVLDESITYKEQMNLVVELNGKRIQPPAGRRHEVVVEDNIFETVSFDESGIVQSDITSDDVVVYVNKEIAEYGTKWFFNTSPTQCTVEFYNPIPVGAVVDIYVTKTDGYADYTFNVDNNVLTIIEGYGITLTDGDKISVTSWKDPLEQDMLTKVYTGPVTVIEPTQELFDTYGFDEVGFSETIGIELKVNLFDLNRVVKNSNRLWVTLNGKRLLPSEHYGVSADGKTMAIVGGAIAETDVVVVTSFTNNIVPDKMAFRIFKDMRDNVAVYRIQDDTTTFLTQDLNITDDAIHVNDASKLGEPNLSKALFGIVIINGERITYRERDIVNNELRGLRRGTAGTGMQSLHEAGDDVTNLGKGDLLQTDYDVIWYERGAGTPQDPFDASNLPTPNPYPQSEVDGTLYPAGVIPHIDEDEGFDATYWDRPATTNGLPLQQQESAAARFLRGE